MNKLKTNLTKDYEISRILKGGWQLAGGHGTINREKAIQDMFTFVESGITTFDFADIYTGVEELVGEFLGQYRKRFGVSSLSEIQLHSKFVPDLDQLSKVDRKYVSEGIDRSLKRLGVDRINLVQLHWWDFEVPGYLETAKYLLELQKMGKIKHIGVTNFDVAHLKELVENGITVVSNQVQYSVLDHRPENGMVSYCQKQGIRLLCYGTVAGGFLSEKYLGLSEPKEPLENRSLVKYKLIIDDFGGYKLFQELLLCLNKIAKKHGMSITNVASRYILQKPQVAAVIIGARNSEHLDNNLKVFDFELDAGDLSSIENIIKKSKGPTGDIYALERVKNEKHASIMKYNLNRL